MPTLKPTGPREEWHVWSEYAHVYAVFLSKLYLFGALTKHWAELMLCFQFVFVVKGGGRRLRSLRQQPKPTPRQHRLHKQANICCTQLSFIHSLNYRTQSASQKCIYFVVTVDLLYLHFFNRDYHGIVVVLYLFCFTNTWYV